MAKYRFTRRGRPRIDWQQRMRLQQITARARWVALGLLAVALVVGGLAWRSANLTVVQPTPTPTVTPTDAAAAEIGQLIEQVAGAGQVTPALPSSILYASTATLTPTPSGTPTPTDTPTVTPTPTPTLTPEYIVSEYTLPTVDWEKVSRLRAPLPRETAAFLDPMEQIFQGRDPNESPSLVAMALSYFGADPAKVLPGARAALPYDEESRVTPPGLLVKYLEEQGLTALIYEQATLEQVQQLVTNGVPVIVAHHLLPGVETPHYRIVRGYSDRRGVVMVNDSDLAASLSLSYAEWAGLWAPFDNFTMPVFLPQQTSVVRAILGEEGDVTATYVEQDRKLGQPPIEPTPEVTPPPPGQTPTVPSRPDAPGILTLGAPVSGTITGNAGGSFAFFTLPPETGDLAVKLELSYEPDDPIIARGVGFTVYDGQRRQVGQGANTTGRPGERTLTLLPAPGATRLVQVFNYLPNVTIRFTLTASRP